MQLMFLLCLIKQQAPSENVAILFYSLLTVKHKRFHCLWWYTTCIVSDRVAIACGLFVKVTLRMRYDNLQVQ